MARLTSKKSNCPTRPWHIWNPTINRRIPSRFYSDPKRAHMGVLKELRWAKVGHSLEVLNVITGQTHGKPYTRKVNGIEFY